MILNIQRLDSLKSTRIKTLGPVITSGPVKSIAVGYDREDGIHCFIEAAQGENRCVTIDMSAEDMIAVGHACIAMGRIAIDDRLASAADARIEEMLKED